MEVVLLYVGHPHLLLNLLCFCMRNANIEIQVLLLLDEG